MSNLEQINWAEALREPFEIVKREQVDDFIQTSGLICLHQLLESTDELSSFSNGKVLRTYLKQALTQGYFSIKSPRDGRVIKTGASIILPDQSAYVCVPEVPGLLIGIGNLGLGYPICALIFVLQKTVIVLDNDFWSIKLLDFSQLANTIENCNWRPSYASNQLMLVIGDPNYAHNIWNELSTVEEILHIGLHKKPVSLITTHAPVGKVKEIFPELQYWDESHQSWSLLANRNAEGQLILPVGGLKISNTLRQRVLRFAKKQGLSCEAIAVKHSIRRSKPLLWISLRTHNRTAVNLTEMLVDLCHQFLLKNASGKVIIDGFSLSADARTNPSINLPACTALIDADKAQFNEIIELLKQRDNSYSDRVLSAIGFTILESILLAQYPHYYFCHHGTVQHKIGWFTNTSGVVHSNHIVLASLPSTWVAEQSEIAQMPIYIEPQWVEDMQSLTKKGGVQTVLMHDNYLFTDIKAITAFVLEGFEQSIKVKRQNAFIPRWKARLCKLTSFRAVYSKILQRLM